MQVVILAGGMGTRIFEESHNKPKPMVEIGGMPILWHIMKIYSHYGFNDFIIPLGYKGNVIKQYFADYFLRHSDVKFDLQTNSMKILNNSSEPWTVTLVDTGLDTATGGRLDKVKDHITGPFMLTYGDGVADVDIPALLAFHREHGKTCTITAVRANSAFGVLDIADDCTINEFKEKRDVDSTWINAGFMVIEPDIFDHIEGHWTILEQTVMRKLASKSQLVAFKHDGFFSPMDNIKDRDFLNDQWSKGWASWKVWK